MSSFLDRIQGSLNAPQREAVEHEDGPLLILAGAGSGKTRVLTYRIARLNVDLKVPLERILAMTFSNKAAREMHDRVKLLLGDRSPYRYPWISTFHSSCARLLRLYGERIGLVRDFSIYDSEEQLRMIKKCFERLKISEKDYMPKAVLGRISGWKNDGRSVDEVERHLASDFEEVSREVFEEYSKALRQAQAVDFDDLLLLTLKLLKRDQELRHFLRDQWKHILIDEFQDTNRIQLMLIENLINDEQNICVVGDDDQSIYGWRGARVENILEFDRRYDACRIVKLEQNYRSTAHILNAATAVIQKNENRHEKTLWTQKGEGKRIQVHSLEDDREEAYFIIHSIKKLISEGHSAAQIAVLYRINAVSRLLEEECLKQRVPYKIVGGFRFYERKEVKDVLCYLKVLLNPADQLAFIRTVNTPARGIGKVSLEKLQRESQDKGMSPVEYLLNCSQVPISGKAGRGLQGYIAYLRWGFHMLDQENSSLIDLVYGALEKTGYLVSLQKDPSEEAREREANLQELLTAIQEFEENWSLQESSIEGSYSATRRKLMEFMERVALISDSDQLDEAGESQIRLMTLHAAKGLEFEYCFLAALEDGLFPSGRAMNSHHEMEEERRLCYVGITRAKEVLTLTRAQRRRTYGSIDFQLPSRFLRELPSECVEGDVDDYARFRGSGMEEDDFSQDIFDFDFNQEVSLFAKGQRVQHPSFGEGVVRKVEKLGEDECLTIAFMGKGVKRVLSQYVKTA